MLDKLSFQIELLFSSIDHMNYNFKLFVHKFSWLQKEPTPIRICMKQLDGNTFYLLLLHDVSFLGLSKSKLTLYWIRLVLWLKTDEIVNNNNNHHWQFYWLPLDS